MTAADTVAVRLVTTKLEDEPTHQRVRVQLVTATGDPIWTSEAVAKRRGAFRWDYRPLFKQRRDADAFLRSRPDLRLEEA